MMVRPRRRKVSIALLVAACVGLGSIAAFGVDDGLIYYRTPTEIVHAAREEGTVRVGGLVVVGSVTESARESTLLLTDGPTEIEVRYPGRLPDVVREGEGAVVEGRWDTDGVLQAEELLLRHSNEYKASEDPLP